MMVCDKGARKIYLFIYFKISALLGNKKSEIY